MRKEGGGARGVMLSARGNSASSSLKSGGAIAPTAPTVPTPMYIYHTLGNCVICMCQARCYATT